METNSQQQAFDSFNDNQKDNRSRTTQLANFAFLIAGASLTTSITIFASRPKGQITPATLQFLHTGWRLLLVSIVSFLVLLTAMIVRDYLIAELEWRPQLYGKAPLLKGKWRTFFFSISEPLLFVSGLLGLICLCFGLHQIMKAAITSLA